MLFRSDEDNIEKMYSPFDPLKSLNINKCQKLPLLTRVMENGERTGSKRAIAEIAGFTQKQLQKLPDEYKRFDNPHIYKIGLSEALHTLRNRLIQEHKNVKL